MRDGMKKDKKEFSPQILGESARLQIKLTLDALQIHL